MKRSASGVVVTGGRGEGGVRREEKAGVAADMSSCIPVALSHNTEDGGGGEGGR